MIRGTGDTEFQNPVDNANDHREVEKINGHDGATPMTIGKYWQGMDMKRGYSQNTTDTDSSMSNSEKQKSLEMQYSKSSTPIVWFVRSIGDWIAARDVFGDAETSREGSRSRLFTET